MKSNARNTSTKKGPPIGNTMTSAPFRSDSKTKSSPSQTSMATDFRSVRIDGAMISAGSSMAIEMFNRRDFSKIAQYVADANSKTDEHIRSCGLSTLFGIGCTLASGLQEATNKGWLKLTGDKLPTTADLHYSLKTDAKAFSAQLTAIVRVAQRAGAAAKGLKILARTESAGNAPAPVDDRPTKIEIVSMPDRLTTTDLDRDSSGNIKTTVQLEKDAA
ncbi:MAG: hypothetical protein IPO00_16540 [Betaproteobacteria bacterium]|nr:hypothetical protein [Betaproteobacteria bacterium]